MHVKALCTQSHEHYQSRDMRKKWVRARLYLVAAMPKPFVFENVVEDVRTVRSLREAGIDALHTEERLPAFVERFFRMGR